MTEGVFTEMMATPDEPDAFDAMAPENVVAARRVARVAAVRPRHRPRVRGRGRQGRHRRRLAARPVARQGARWDAAELGPVVDELLADAPAPAPVYGATD